MDSTTLPIQLSASLLSVWPDFGQLLARMSERRGLVALDSAAGQPREWSWIAWDPLDLQAALPASVEGLRMFLSQVPVIHGDELPGPFQGGFMGALAYDPGVPGEGQELPMDPWGLPSLVGGIYTDFFVFNHRKQELHLVTPAWRTEHDAAALRRLAEESMGEPQAAGAFCAEGDLERMTSSAEHQARIQAARLDIAQGEFYQTNLAHAFEAQTAGDPLDLYLELRRVNPAPYMCYIRFEGGAIMSASPELLLQVRQEFLRSRPIKGTAPRSADPLHDAALGEALLDSAKDCAELAMIVDLLRNDLGRVARLGSVHVEHFPELRSYEGVHHLMADVCAELADGKDALDALASVFPGGSITGAPKLRAMQAIAEYEKQGRGFFTGSAGFVDGQGNACFNILIRTLQWRPRGEAGLNLGQVKFHVGGGITWSSDAVEEDIETLVKGARLARALGFELNTNPLVDEEH